MSSAKDSTFIEKIQAKRMYADVPITESENSDKSSSATESGKVLNTTSPNLTKEKCKQDGEEGDFKTMIAEELSDSEEENDKVIDLTNVNFKVPPAKEKRPSDENHSRKCDLPCDIFYLNDQTHLQKFETFDQLSGYLVNASTQEKDERIEPGELFKTLEHLPLRKAEHLITVGEYLSRLYEDEQLIDIIMEVQGKTFYAHRVALCCSSQFFSEFFDRHNRDKLPYSMKIKGVTVEAFASFLEFCYTGELTVFPETAADIIVMADFLKVTHLQERYHEVGKSLPLEKTLQILVKTKTRSSAKLYNVLFNKVLQSFVEASQIDIFFNMDVSLLCWLLESDELVASSEYEIFTIALRWIVHDIDSRVKYTMRVLAFIRFYHMTPMELFLCGETTSLLRGYDKFREMLLIANWLQTADILERNDPFNFPRPEPRLCFVRHQGKVTETTTNVTLRMPPPLMTSTPKPTPKSKEYPTDENENASDSVDIFVVGGFISDGSKQQSKYVERYDIVDNQWLHFSGLPAPTRRHAVVCLDNKLYLIGGSEPCNKNVTPVPRNTAYRMDMGTKKWTQICDMNVYRHSHCACALNGQIFVIGGKGKFDSVLLSVECYDPETEGWFFVPSLPEPIFGASAAALGSRIIVAGGIGSDTEKPSVVYVHSAVYSFNPTSNGWTRLHDLRFPRCLSALVNVEGSLYMCGGATQSYESKSSLCSVSSVDKYDDVKDEWNHVTDMVIPRHDCGAAVAGSRIYMIGGVSSPPERVLQSIECYDTTRKCWVTGIQDLPYPARWICCCSMHTKSTKPQK